LQLKPIKTHIFEKINDLAYHFLQYLSCGESKAMDDLEQGQIHASRCQMLLKFKEPILSMIVIMCVYKAG